MRIIPRTTLPPRAPWGNVVGRYRKHLAPLTMALLESADNGTAIVVSREKASALGQNQAFLRRGLRVRTQRLDSGESAVWCERV